MSKVTDRRIVHAPVGMRPMVAADLPRVLKVENRVYSYPWSRQNFVDCLGGSNESWIMHADDVHLGHSVISAAAGESHLLNISVDAAYQRQGLGRKLLRFVTERARKLGAKVMFLEVRVSNDGAYQLYVSEGFSEVGVRKGYYPAGNKREDALILGFELY